MGIFAYESGTGRIYLQIVCMHACVGACVRVCVHVYVRVCGFWH